MPKSWPLKISLAKQLEDPETEFSPVGHAVQDVEFWLPEYVPAGQGVQDALDADPYSVENVPAGQGVQDPVAPFTSE